MGKDPLTVHNAEIKTATVEIRTLTISGKQVTLAVFRQLREEPLIAGDGTLNGLPWGVVNYHPDKCAGEAEHSHVVWQRGDELLRSTVPGALEFGAFASATANLYLMACVSEHVHGGTRHFHDQPLLKPDDYERNIKSSFLTARHIELSGLRVKLSASPEAARVVTALHKLVKEREDTSRPTWVDERRMREWRESRERGVAWRQENFDEALAAFDAQWSQWATGTADELYEQLKAECEAETERRSRHHAVRAAIADLPQLFIAV